jgi:hypothetical protein
LEQAPGPRGSPQDPHPAAEDSLRAGELPLDTAKVERSFKTSRLSQAGQPGFVPPSTTCSNFFPQRRHAYSKSGMSQE